MAGTFEYPSWPHYGDENHTMWNDKRRKEYPFDPNHFDDGRWEQVQKYVGEDDRLIARILWEFDGVIDTLQGKTKTYFGDRYVGMLWYQIENPDQAKNIPATMAITGILCTLMGYTTRILIGTNGDIVNYAELVVKDKDSMPALIEEVKKTYPECNFVS